MKPQIILCFLIFAALIVVIGTSSFSTTQDHSKEDLEERTSTTAASPIKKKGSKPDIKIASQFRTQIRRRSIQQVLLELCRFLQTKIILKKSNWKKNTNQLHLLL